MSLRRLIEVLTVLKLVFRSHCFTGLALGTHHQNRATFGRNLLNELGRFLKHRKRFFKINDVDFVAMAKNKGGHLRIPEACLVPKVDAGFQHFAHGNCHEYSKG